MKLTTRVSVASETRVVGTVVGTLSVTVTCTGGKVSTTWKALSRALEIKNEMNWTYSVDYGYVLNLCLSYRLCPEDISFYICQTKNLKLTP